MSFFVGPVLSCSYLGESDLGSKGPKSLLNTPQYSSTFQHSSIKLYINIFIGTQVLPGNRIELRNVGMSPNVSEC